MAKLTISCSDELLKRCKDAKADLNFSGYVRMRLSVHWTCWKPGKMQVQRLNGYGPRRTCMTSNTGTWA